MPNPDGSLTAEESAALLQRAQQALAELEVLKADMIRKLPPRGRLPLPLSLEERVMALEAHLGFRESAEEVMAIPAPEEVAAQAAASANLAPRPVAMPIGAPASTAVVNQAPAPAGALPTGT